MTRKHAGLMLALLVAALLVLVILPGTAGAEYLTEVEPNDDWDAPMDLSLNCTVTGIMEEMDNDIYRLTLTEGALVKYEFKSYYNAVYFSFSDRYYGNYGQLYGQSGGSSSKPAVFSKEVYLEAGTYYFLVQYMFDSLATNVGVYEISVETEYLGVNETEPNDLPDQAMALPLNGTVRGLMSEDDVYDFYALTLDSTAHVTYEVKAYMRYLYFNVTKDGDSGNFGSNTSWNGTMDHPGTYTKDLFLEAGTYYFKMEKYGSSTTYPGLYDITITTDYVNANEIEPNDSKDTAMELPLNGSVRGYMANEDTTDYFKLTLTRSACVSVEVKCYFDSMRLYFENDSTSTLAKYGTWGGTRDKPAVYTEDLYLEAGTYHIKLNKYASDQGIYELNIATEWIGSVGSEPNDTENTADYIPLSRSYLTGINSYFSDRKDMYVFDVPYEQTIYVDVKDHLGGISWKLTNTSGTRLAHDSNPSSNRGFSNTSVGSILLPAGTYYLELSWYSSTPKGTYEFRVYGGELAYTITNLRPDTSSVEAGQQVSFLLSSVGDEQILEMEYRVYNENNELVSGWSGISSVYNFTPLRAGVYTAMVRVRTADGWQEFISKPLNVTGAAFELESLTTTVTSAKVGDVVTYTANITGMDQVLEMEYHVYNEYGQHISGWNGISSVYNYVASTPGTFTLRVYVRTAAGWVQVDSLPLKVTAGSLKAVALKASGTTAKVGDVLTFTTEFEGDGPIAWIEYHIYDTYGQHLTGYRGEGDSISGVYNYPTVNTGAGKYTARVYLMAADGTFTHVDSVQVTVTGGTRKAVALKASGTTAKVGDVLTFTTQFEGDGEIAWIEYHIYDTYGQHLTGYRGEGDGISGVYNYPTVNTGAGKYTARVYLMAKDGTFTHVDSEQVTVTEAKAAQAYDITAATPEPAEEPTAEPTAAPGTSFETAIRKNASFTEQVAGTAYYKAPVSAGEYILTLRATNPTDVAIYDAARNRVFSGSTENGRLENLVALADGEYYIVLSSDGAQVELTLTAYVAPTEEPTEEATEEPEITAEPVEKPVDEMAEEPAEESVEEPTEEPAAETAEEPEAEPAAEAVEEPEVGEVIE